MTDDAVVQAAIGYMWRNYQQDVTLDRVAAHAMYSKFYFLRRFKAATGVTPGRFLTTIRLARSKELLIGAPQMSITDIALEVGYDSIGAFSTKFRQVVGMTPSEYRAAHLADDVSSSTAGQMVAQAVAFRPDDTVLCEGRVTGHVPDPRSTTFVGLFDGVAPQGRPSGCAVIEGIDRDFELHAPRGTWNVMAVTLATNDSGTSEVVAVGSSGLLEFTSGRALGVMIEMRSDIDHSLPVLGAFPEMHAIQHSALEMVV